MIKTLTSNQNPSRFKELKVADNKTTLQMFIRAYHTFIVHEQISERKSYKETLSRNSAFDQIKATGIISHTHTAIKREC